MPPLRPRKTPTGVPNERLVRRPRLAPTPIAPPPVQQETPVDPFQNFQNFEQFAANVRTRTAGGVHDAGPDPFSGFQPEQHPAGGLGSIVNPFNRTGAPITRGQLAEFQRRSGFLHKPGQALQGKQFAERVLSGRTGAEGQPEVPIMDIITGKSHGADIVVIRNPEQLPERVLTLWKAKRQSIRRDFAEIMRRNTGDFSLAELNDIGEQLASQNGNHREFIGNMLQKFIKDKPNLKAEFDQLRLTGTTASTGNETFQQLEPAQRARFSNAFEAAFAEVQRVAALPEDQRDAAARTGRVDPEFLEELGFRQDGKGGPFTTVTFGGETRPITARDIVEVGNERFELGGLPPPPAAPIRVPEPPSISGRPLGPVKVGPSAPLTQTLTEQPGIEGVISGPGGTIVRLQGGAEIDQEDAPEQIQALRRSGTAPHLALADNLEEAFDITVPQPEPTEGDDPVTVVAEAENGELASTGMLRRDKDDNTMIWNIAKQEWVTLVTKDVREFLGDRRNLEPPAVRLYKHAAKLIFSDLKLLKQATTVWVAEQRKAAEAAWRG